MIDFSIQVLQLKDHIASGAPDQWIVITDNGNYGPYDNYGEASAKFDELPSDRHPNLTLYTRIGTGVSFRYKDPGKPSE